MTYEFRRLEKIIEYSSTSNDKRRKRRAEGVGGGLEHRKFKIEEPCALCD